MDAVCIFNQMQSHLLTCAAHTLCSLSAALQESHEPKEMKAALAKERINISVSAAPSTLLDFQARELRAVARASVHYYNNEQEIDMLVTALVDLVCSKPCS